jgi:3',5'-cyclic AMP phosphodiesterase CpdA
VISDIEGNFGAFRKLLQAAGVINDRFEWTFGDGHLVLAGDFFDRGSQVTEVLWLCYALEEMAGKAGGYVHFILGNHEIMNLSADYRYLHPKYQETAAIMKVDLRALYGDDTELGRWLRTKNVMEKVGRNLYLHGGVSRLVNNVDWDLPAINAKARPFYADTIFAYPDLQTELLFSDLGPFWYRGYYMGDVGQIPGVLDSTLGKFRVDRVVTGHTPVADTVSGWYGGKLFNVDTPHRSGKSQAMLLEGGRIYIIDAAGGKMLFKG